MSKYDVDVGVADTVCVEPVKGVNKPGPDDERATAQEEGEQANAKYHGQDYAARNQVESRFGFHKGIFLMVGHSAARFVTPEGRPGRSKIKNKRSGAPPCGAVRSHGSTTRGEDRNTSWINSRKRK